MSPEERAWTSFYFLSETALVSAYWDMAGSKWAKWLCFQSVEMALLYYGAQNMR